MNAINLPCVWLMGRSMIILLMWRDEVGDYDQTFSFSATPHSANPCLVSLMFFYHVSFWSKADQPNHFTQKLISSLESKLNINDSVPFTCKDSGTQSFYYGTIRVTLQIAYSSSKDSVWFKAWVIIASRNIHPPS